MASASRSPAPSPLALAAFCAGMAAASAAAQAAPPQGQGVTATLDGLYQVPEEAMGNIATYRVDLAPDAFSVRHRHGGLLVFHVISGAVRTQVDDGSVRTYRAGQSFMERPWNEVMLLENDSRTEPASLLAVFLGRCEVAPPSLGH
jgi:quercetin dioxygenase-like cupin family protein